MKNLSLLILSTILMTFSSLTSKAQGINFQVTSICWYELNGEHFFRVATNSPYGTPLDAHIYVNLPGSGWTGQLLRKTTYPHPTHPGEDVHIFSMQDNGYSLPNPLNPGDCFDVFVHPNATVIPPNEFTDIQTACMCESECNSNFTLEIADNGMWVSPHVTNYNPSAVYSWTWGDGTSTSNNPTPLKPYGYCFPPGPGAGTYTICMIVDDGNTICRRCKTICIFEDNTAGTGGGGEGKPGKKTNGGNRLSIGNQAIDMAADIKVYPVPVNDVLKISNFHSGKNEVVTINIIDANGRIVKSENTTTAASNNYSVKVNELPSGVYILQVSGSRESKTTRFNIVK